MTDGAQEAEVGQPPRLGLALSGGGFRAALFHLGVLHRLAELGLLRRVRVLSTVSGGSVLAGLYYLRLKRALESAPQVDYVGLMREVSRELRDGIAANLRNRLFLNPWRNLAIICLGESLGRRMAGLYTRFIYGRVLREAFPDELEWQRSGVPLMNARVDLRATADVRFGAGADQQLTASIEGFNARSPDVVPKLVLNATSLNTGSEFRFEIAELGDPALGFLRFDEIELVNAYRALLRRTGLLYKPRNRRPAFGFGRVAPKVDRFPQASVDDRLVERELTGAHLAWWSYAVYADDLVARGRDPDPPERVLPLDGLPLSVRILLESRQDVLRVYSARPGHLRRAKMAAWNLLSSVSEQAPDGRPREDHAREFWSAVRDIDVLLAERLSARMREAQALEAQLWTFFYQVYFFRTASTFDTDRERLKRLTLSDAVAASANFPPIFPPFEIRGVFDAAQMQRLALTDGGVYDNQGITALLDDGCTHIIASDAGGLPEYETAPARGRAGMMLRIVDVLMVNLREWQLRHLRNEVLSSGLADQLSAEALRGRSGVRSVAFFHMTSDPHDALPPGAAPLPPHAAAPDVARIRTDLDLFNDAESEALIYQGYQLADRFVRTHLSGFGLEDGPAPDAGIALGTPSYDHRAKTTRPVLEAAAQRFFRLFRLSPALKWIAVGFLVAAAAWLLCTHSLEGIAAAVGRGVWDYLRSPLFSPGMPAAEVFERPGFGVFLLGVLVACCFLATRYEKLRLLPRNLLWLFGLLPLALALLLAALSFVMHAVVGAWWVSVGRRKG